MQISNEDSTRKRITEIDGLRAISVLIVVFGHAGLSLVSASTGVTYFFVISGYVITKTLLSEFTLTSSFSIRRFFLRRFFKLFPPLISIIILPSILFLEILNLNAYGLVSQVLFYFNWTSIYFPQLKVLPGSGVTWSLSVEEQFYILIALVWLTIVKFGQRYAIKLLFLLYSILYVSSTFTRFLLYFSSDNLRDEYGEIPRIMRGLDSRMSAIALGGLITLFIFRIEQKSNIFLRILGNWKLVFPISMLLYLASYFPFEFFYHTLQFNFREISVGFIITHIEIRDKIASFTFFDFLNLRILQIIGLSSYSIYLSHLVLIRSLDQIGVFDFGILNVNFINSLFKILFAVIVGIVLHKLFDEPFEPVRARFRISRFND